MYTSVRVSPRTYLLRPDKLTKHPRGRTVTRLLREELVQKLEAQYEQPESQNIYGLRKQNVESPFGYMKTVISQTGGANWLLADSTEGKLITELKASGRFGRPL
jgi:hypothetical protein